jgi:hypothetical protein
MKRPDDEHAWLEDPDAWRFVDDDSAHGLALILGAAIEALDDNQVERVRASLLRGVKRCYRHTPHFKRSRRKWLAILFQKGGQSK